MALRALSESVEISVSLWAFSESVSPQLAHGTSVSPWAFNVSVEPFVSEGPQQLQALNEPVDFQ